MPTKIPQISRLSSPFCSIYDEAIYEVVPISTSNASTSYEVEILELSTMQVIGIKRFNHSPALVNVAPYARQLLNIDPLITPDQEFRFEIAPTHSTQLVIRLDTTLSLPLTLFHTRCQLADIKPVMSLSPMSNDLYYGDQIKYSLLISEPSILSVKAQITTLNGQQFELQIPDFQANSGIHILHFGAEPIRQVALSAGFTLSDCISAELQLFNNNQLVCSFNCNLLPPISDITRLCWLNRNGGLSFFTFNNLDIHNFDVCRHKLQTVSKTSLSVDNIALKLELLTTYFADNKVNSLADILYSEHLWIVTNGHFTPIILDFGKVIRHPNNMSQISLQVSTSIIE